MIKEGFYLEPARWDIDSEPLRYVREQVFIQEQNIPEEEEWDAVDAPSLHVLARDEKGRPIGCGRLTPDGMIGRMAVLKSSRGKGVGGAILEHLVDQARERRLTEISLHAQVVAIPFYEHYGFRVEGDEYLEVGIPHRNMRRAVNAWEAPDRPGERLEQPLEGKVIEVVTREQGHAAVLELCALAKHQLCIYSHDLDAVLYNHEDSLQAIRRIALSGRTASVRILLQEAEPAIKLGHRLIHLSRRLPSIIIIRTPLAEEDRKYPSAFLLNDRRGFYFRTLGSRCEGEMHSYAPGPHRELQTYFNQIWDRSGPNEELRQLSY